MNARLLKITLTSVNKFGQRVLKAVGLSSTYTAEQYGPYGTDANPINKTAVIYMPTDFNGDECFIGCLNKNQKAEVGEHRIFCTDKDGAFKFNIWLRSDGTYLMGTSDDPADYTNFATKYNESKTELDALKSTVNDLVGKWNTFAGAYVPGGPALVGTPPTLAGQNVPVNNSNFANIKNENIKTN